MVSCLIASLSWAITVRRMPPAYAAPLSKWLPTATRWGSFTGTHTHMEFNTIGIQHTDYLLTHTSGLLCCLLCVFGSTSVSPLDSQEGHRDLKPENFLLTDNSPTADLKCIDFGLSAFFQPGQVFKDVVGSPYYVAPEVLRGRYSYHADMWSCGVILYILLCGIPPFWGETEQAIIDAILKGKYDFDGEPWPQISDEAKDCIRRLLLMVCDMQWVLHDCLMCCEQSRMVMLMTALENVVTAFFFAIHQDPSKRATAEDILAHPWMRENGVASDKPLDNLIVTRMRKFGGLNALKRQAMQFIVQTLSPEELAGLRNQFMVCCIVVVCCCYHPASTLPSPCIHVALTLQSLDKDGNGSITVDELKEGFRKMGTLLEDNEVGAVWYSDDTLRCASWHPTLAANKTPPRSSTAWCGLLMKTIMGRLTMRSL